MEVGVGYAGLDTKAMHVMIAITNSVDEFEAEASAASFEACVYMCAHTRRIKREIFCLLQ